MLSFESLWVFWLLPLPFLVYRFWPAAKQQQAAVRVPFYSELSDLSDHSTTTVHGKKIKLGIISLIWCCLITAAATPTWIGDPVSLPNNGRELILAVDLSGSMTIQDMVIAGEKLFANKIQNSSNRRWKRLLANGLE